MRWFVSKLRGWLPARRPNLRCAREVWRAGVAELERRTLNHTRESGAYLLGLKLDDGSRRILQFVYYDDIDPLALASGVVVIRQTALPKLWALCRQLQLSVVADVHVHPGSFRQSQSDRENPVMPRAGHYAMVLPNYAAGRPEPGRIGQYEFLGGGRWRDHSGRGGRFLQLDNGQ